jgi:hypothetical protein
MPTPSFFFYSSAFGDRTAEPGAKSAAQVLACFEPGLHNMNYRDGGFLAPDLPPPLQIWCQKITVR